MERESEIDLVGREAAYLSLVEIGLGSLLHGIGVPLAGYFLSMNQGFFLARSVAQARVAGLAGARSVPWRISCVAAVLKSLSPAGKKLTPMLAISVQGGLFSLGTGALGAGLPGVMLGSLLASFWAFIQPLLVYSLLYGRTLIETARFYEEKFGLLWMLATLVGAKAVVSMALGWAGYRISETRFAAYRARLSGSAAAARKNHGAAISVTDSVADSVAGASAGLGLPQSWRASARGALRDLTRPMFWVPLGMTVAFFVYAEASFASLAWIVLRPIAVGFLVFALIRRVSVDSLAVRLERAGFAGFGRSLAAAVAAIKRV